MVGAVAAVAVDAEEAVADFSALATSSFFGLSKCVCVRACVLRVSVYLRFMLERGVGDENIPI